MKSHVFFKKYVKRILSQNSAYLKKYFDITNSDLSTKRANPSSFFEGVQYMAQYIKVYIVRHVTYDLSVVADPRWDKL